MKSECQRRIREELRLALHQRFSRILQPADEWDIVSAPPEDDPDHQTLLFHYPETLANTASYLRPDVKIEMGARSDNEPTEGPTIRPYLADAFPDIVGDTEFPVRVLAPERTFWEKAMLLHEETFRPVSKPRKSRMARHYYDLWCLITKGVAARAVARDDIFRRTAEHREIYFNWSWMDYSTLQRGSLRLVPRRDQQAEWRQDYDTMMRNMFFGKVPGFDDVLQVVGEFERDFNGP